MDYLKLAEVIAKGSHHGQFDKGGMPYYTHPMIVSYMVNNKDEKIVAWLHDVVEDTNVTIEDLSEMFPENVVTAVDAITKRENETRNQYLDRVKANKLATVVKIADLKHNSNLNRIAVIRDLTEEDYARVDKYKKEIEFLQS